MTFIMLISLEFWDISNSKNFEICRPLHALPATFCEIGIVLIDDLMKYKNNHSLLSSAQVHASSGHTCCKNNVQSLFLPT